MQTISVELTVLDEGEVVCVRVVAWTLRLFLSAVSGGTMITAARPQVPSSVRAGERQSTADFPHENRDCRCAAAALFGQLAPPLGHHGSMI